MTAIAGDQRSKPYPTAIARLTAPRHCLRCQQLKPFDAFDMGPSNRFRLRVCRDCYAAERAAKEQRHAEWQATWTDPRTGVVMRRCAHCREVKPLEAGFYRGKPKGRTQTERYDYRCKSCHVQFTAELVRRTGWRTPERMRKHRESSKARLAADPVRAEMVRKRTNRLRRKSNRRKRIARGQGVRPAATAAEIRRWRDGVGTGAIPAARRLPSRPFVDALLALAQRRGMGRAELCARYGVNEKALYEWDRGSRPVVDAQTADRILVGTPLLWWDVWPEGSEGHYRAAAYFTGARPGSAVQ